MAPLLIVIAIPMEIPANSLIFLMFMAEKTLLAKFAKTR